MNTITIQLRDINSIVSIHLKAFKVFFLTELGPSFLSTYYKAVLKNEKGILLGIKENNDIVGFCAATMLSKGFNRNLIKENFIKFTLSGIHILITNPMSIIRLIKNLSKKKSKMNDNGEYAELLSIGVDPSVQGKGIGRTLLKSLEKDLNAKKIRKLTLTTDYYNNDKTISFYKNNGFEVWYVFITYPNRKMYKMIKELDIQ